jgi:hypothetical protein
VSTLTCEQVEAGLELYAADECDAAAGAATAAHLAECPACSAKYREAQELLGLLELRLREPERLRRLLGLLAAEPKRQRRPAWVLAFPRRVAALAAMLLLTLGLSGWLGPFAGPGDGGLDLQVAVAPVERQALIPDVAPGFERATMKSVDNTGQFAPAEAKTFEWEATRVGEPRERPEARLTLDLRNQSGRAVLIHLDDDRTELALDLEGPGVARTPAPTPALWLGGLGPVRLAPGKAVQLTVERLEEGTRGAVRVVSWTKPGDYTLTARLRTPVETVGSLVPRMETFTGPPVKLHVKPEP